MVRWSDRGSVGANQGQAGPFRVCRQRRLLDLAVMLEWHTEQAENLCRDRGVPVRIRVTAPFSYLKGNTFGSWPRRRPHRPRRCCRGMAACPLGLRAMLGAESEHSESEPAGA